MNLSVLLREIQVARGSLHRILNAPFVPVRNYGAAGNDSADDYAAIQRVYDYLDTIGGGIAFFHPGTYLTSQRPAVPSNVTIMGSGASATTIKARSNNVATNGLVLGIISVSDVKVLDITLDGNSSALSGTPELFRVFSSTDVLFERVRFRNSRGIGGNLSTNLKRLKIKGCEAYNIGYTTGVGGADAKQAFAFSSSGHEDIEITRNSFENIGLDCISLGGVTRGDISDNWTKANCYTLIYNVIAAESSFLTIKKNKVTTAASAVAPQPNGIDLPSVVDSTVEGNIAVDCQSAGIGIFQGCKRVAVSDNITLRNAQHASALYPAGIAIKGVSTNKLSDIKLTGNIGSDNAVSKTQDYGLVYDPDDITNFVLDRTNQFSGNATADIAIFNYPDSGSGTVTRTESQRYVAPMHPGYVSGNWYAPPHISLSAAPSAQTADTLYAIPWVVHEPITVSTLGVRIHSGVGATQALLGIYANSTGGRPGVRINKVSSAVSGTAAASVENALDSNQFLMPGIYWLVALCDGAISIKTIATTNIGSCFIGSTTQADIANAVNVVGLSVAKTYANGLPATLIGETFTNITGATCPVINFKIA